MQCTARHATKQKLAAKRTPSQGGSRRLRAYSTRTTCRSAAAIRLSASNRTRFAAIPAIRLSSDHMSYQQFLWQFSVCTSQLTLNQLQAGLPGVRWTAYPACTLLPCQSSLLCSCLAASRLAEMSVAMLFLVHI